ncbi:hypothetical protein [Paenibacillus hamazuiensis]|uniref:hypothetical protein n=1 Tax=Paenibacillus hamazuiensis TaxID=2936508 RepID=UPI00200D8EFA|nr:hypothetical protein [Paenibacillus hamazuiensis]
MTGYQRVDEANRHVFPDWIELQNEISEEITDLMIAMDEGTDFNLTHKLDGLNEKISRYNEAVPSVHLKKPHLTPGQLAKQAYLWV